MLAADLLLISTLGFLGSFGHCASMCGPLATAFSLSHQAQTWQAKLRFQLLLNLGRLISYALIGAGIGALGSVLIAGGQIAGIGSALRQSMSIVTGLMLIWMGLLQLNPKVLPRIPLLHPILQIGLHSRLSKSMAQLAQSQSGWTPLLLGLIWGLIPCGFLYAAQLKAAETGHLWGGLITMMAFGIGTCPTMIGIGAFMGLLSADRRSQLFRAGGWITLAIGSLTLLRTDAMVDYTGHLALLGLMLALMARPLSRIWSGLLTYRRALGVGAFSLGVIHMGHSLDHTFNWDLSALDFLLPTHQVAIWLGFTALALMMPAALTSFDQAVIRLGSRWRQIHLLTVPALICVTIHTCLIGSHYWGGLALTPANHGAAGILIISVGLILLARQRWVWSLLSLGSWYTAPSKAKLTKAQSTLGQSANYVDQPNQASESLEPTLDSHESCHPR